MTVKEMLKRIDSLEITEHMAFMMNEAEDEKRAGLEAKARAGVKQRKWIKK